MAESMGTGMPEPNDHHGSKAEGAGDAGLLRLLHERASLRDFADRPVPEEVLQQILTAGTHSATGGNLQPYSVILVRDGAARARLAEWCEQSFMAKAPVHLLFCIDFHRLERWADLERAPYSARKSFHHFWIGFQDTIICAQSISTAADALGLGSVYIGTILDFARKTRELFALPEGVFPVVLVCLGYPRIKPSPRRKLEQSAVVHEERYSEISDADLLAAFGAKYAGVKVEPTEERVRTLEQVCRSVHGDEFARAALEMVRERGHINAAQRLFGLHYRADVVPTEKKAAVAATEEAGFAWFR